LKKSNEGGVNMKHWWDKPGSLNLVNKIKLSQKIHRLMGNVISSKKKLSSLIRVADQLENDSKQFSELKNQDLLTAKHLVHLRPLLLKSEKFNENISDCIKKINEDDWTDEQAI
jgi:hypothetical protein